MSHLPPFVSSHDYLLSFLLFASLTLSAVSKRCRYLIVSIVLTGLLVVLDLTRLQPWVYQYALMLAIVACLREDETNETTARSVIVAEGLVIATLYLWSGVQKLNWSFSHDVIPGLLKEAGIYWPSVNSSYLWAVGFGVAICEALIGVGLLIRRTRSVAVMLAVGMHLLVLLTLVLAWRNSVVWLWNIAMIVMVVLVFSRTDITLLRHSLRWSRVSDVIAHLPKAIILICGLVPALSFFGWWDQYLSAALYSGKSPVGVIRISESVRGRLPGKTQMQLFTTGQGELMLPLYEWSLGDLNVPPYPEVRVYRQVARQVCALANDEQGIELIVKDRISLIDGSYVVTRTDCPDLLAH